MIPAPGIGPPATTIAAQSVADSILSLLGNTPIVRLSRLAAFEGVDGEFQLKLEYQNPGGSHKSRISYNMVLRGEERGDLVRGSGQTILEPTGGNTGMGLAIAARLLGYRLVLVVPDNYSPEKQRKLKLYGARIILSDSRTGNNSHGELARLLHYENPDWVLLNQQANPANPAAHDMFTGPEIVAALGDRPPDYFIGGIGTGGHLSGVGRVLKARWPEVRVIAVQPEGCHFPTETFVPHRIQGLAVGLVPANLDRSIVDDYATVSDIAAVRAVRTLIDTEGIGVGISTGANLAVALRLARAHPGKRFLSLAYDRVDEYLDEIDAIDPLPFTAKESPNDHAN